MQAGFENRLLSKTSALALAIGAGLGASGVQAAVVEGVFDPTFFGLFLVGDGEIGSPGAGLDVTAPTAPPQGPGWSPQFQVNGITGFGLGIELDPGVVVDFATISAIVPEDGNRILGFMVPEDPNNSLVKPGSYATALGEGAIIGEAGQTFVEGNEGSGEVILAKGLAGTDGGSPLSDQQGDFCGSGGAFIGLEFDLAGQTHYGWIEAYGFESCIVGLRRYGYETVADAPITTPEFLPALTQADLPVPEPSGLALLASGAIGILALRRRQRRLH